MVETVIGILQCVVNCLLLFANDYLIINTALIIVINGCVIHELAHFITAKILGVKSAKMKYKYKIPFKMYIEDENEERNLSFWSFLLISITGSLVSALSILLYYRENLISECFLYFYMLLMICAGYIDYWKLLKHTYELVTKE